MIDQLNINSFSNYLKPRSRESHKGDFGKILIIGGDLAYSGAVRLAGEAALRVGAGCVKIATRPEHAFILNASCPELMCHGVSSPAELKELLAYATCVVIGPGLGREPWGQELLHFVLEKCDKPLLLDADALNNLAEMKWMTKKENWIFTPHPGEAARLLKITSEEIQKDRLSALKKLHELLGGIVVLKGAGTLVLSNHIQAEICHAGNPGMATAGMGDVLCGVISGIAAQNIPLFDAVRLGVLVHAMAGDLAAMQGERGMIASDLVSCLRAVVNKSFT